MSETGARPETTDHDPDRGDEVSVVAQVLASVEALGDQPVADHVAVYEHAHEQLRRALDPRHG